MGRRTSRCLRYA